MTLYTDADLTALVSPHGAPMPLMDGNHVYDVTVTRIGGMEATAYEVQAPNAKTAKTIGREYAARMDRRTFSAHHGIVATARRADR